MSKTLKTRLLILAGIVVVLFVSSVAISAYRPDPKTAEEKQYVDRTDDILELMLDDMPLIQREQRIISQVWFDAKQQNYSPATEKYVIRNGIYRRSPQALYAVLTDLPDRGFIEWTNRVINEQIAKTDVPPRFIPKHIQIITLSSMYTVYIRIVYYPFDNLYLYDLLAVNIGSSLRQSLTSAESQWDWMSGW